MKRLLGRVDRSIGLEDARRHCARVRTSIAVATGRYTDKYQLN